MKLAQKIHMAARLKCAEMLLKIQASHRRRGLLYRRERNAAAPLTPQEEAALLARLGTDEGVKTTLIEHNLRLVVYIARKFENTNVGIEDLISIGSIGLIKAINTFKPDKNIKLATYASRCIENEILMYLRKNQNIKTEISIDEPLNVDWDGNERFYRHSVGGGRRYQSGLGGRGRPRAFRPCNQ